MLCLHRADVNPDSLDSQRIWQWRNDPVTRAMSVTTEEIPWERHRAWYAQAAADPSRVLLLASEGEAAVGMVRFDLRALADAEVSINLNPQVRGSGQGRRVLAAACRWGFSALHRDCIYATIKPDNLRSIRTFEATGFVLIESTALLLTYRLLPEQLVGAPEGPQ